MDHKTDKLPLGVKQPWSPINSAGGAKALKINKRVVLYMYWWDRF